MSQADKEEDKVRSLEEMAEGACGSFALSACRCACFSRPLLCMPLSRVAPSRAQAPRLLSVVGKDKEVMRRSTP